MKLTLKNTTKIVDLNGVPARIWQGQTDSGIPVVAYITRVQVSKDADCEQFSRELQETAAPRADVQAIPMRLIL